MQPAAAQQATRRATQQAAVQAAAQAALEERHAGVYCGCSLLRLRGCFVHRPTDHARRIVRHTQRRRRLQQPQRSA
jgi:hypothetical protein